MVARPTRASLTADLSQVARIVLAAALSWQLAQWALSDAAAHPPVYAVMVPLVAMRDHPYSAFNVSADRILGVVAGVVIGILVVQWLGITTLAVAIVLAAGLVLGTLLRLGPAMNVQAAVSGLLVFANPDRGAYAFYRLWETALGAAVTVLVSALVLPPHPRRRLETQLQVCTDGLADVLDRCAAALPGPLDRTTADALRDAARTAAEQARALPGAYDSALAAVARNPVRRADRAPIEALHPRIALAAELGPVVNLLVDETADLALRADLQPAWARMAGPLPGVLRPVAAVVRARLEPAGVDGSAALDEAAAAVRAWQRTDHSRSTAVLRRPVHRLLVLLGAQVLPVSGGASFEETSVAARAAQDPGGAQAT